MGKIADNILEKLKEIIKLPDNIVSLNLYLHCKDTMPILTIVSNVTETDHNDKHNIKKITTKYKIVKEVKNNNLKGSLAFSNNEIAIDDVKGWNIANTDMLHNNALVTTISNESDKIDIKYKDSKLTYHVIEDDKRIIQIDMLNDSTQQITYLTLDGSTLTVDGAQIYTKSKLKHLIDTLQDCK